MKKWLFDISADGGKTWTTQWLTIREAESEIRHGHIVKRRRNLLIPGYTLKEDL